MSGTELVLLSFYLIEMCRGKQNRIWLRSIHDYPTDWLHFKMLLEEVMEVVHRDQGKVEATISLERHHLAGRSFEGFTSGYAQRNIPFKREYEAVLELEYDPKKSFLQRIAVRKAQFNYTLRHVREDYWWMERGIRWKGPPLIPKGRSDPLDPLGMVMEKTATRYADYSRSAKPNYVFASERLTGYDYGDRTGTYGT